MYYRGIQGQPRPKQIQFYDYTMRFIGCDSIQNCLFVSKRFQSLTVIHRELKKSARQIVPPKTSLRLQLQGAIYRPDSFVLMLSYYANLKAVRYESTSLNRILADKSHRVMVV